MEHVAGSSKSPRGVPSAGCVPHDTHQQASSGIRPDMKVLLDGATLDDVGLYPVTHYVEARRQTIAIFIVNCPIFDYCAGRKRMGVHPR